MERSLRADVVVAGAGNAGLCAALAARERGASVFVLERASRNERGGNSSLTRNMRLAYASWQELVPLLSDADRWPAADLAELLPGYPPEQLYSDWIRVAGQGVEPSLIRTVVSESVSTVKWLSQHGHRWVIGRNPLPGSLQIQLAGGGTRLQSHAFQRLETLGGRVFYDHTLVGIGISKTSRHVEWVETRGPLGIRRIQTRSLVLACGGFEANRSLRVRNMGRPWADVVVRGVPFNDGLGLELALEAGAGRRGAWNACHASPQATWLESGNSPSKVSEVQSATRYAYPFGVMVNRGGRRFLDETSDYGNLTYASVGAKILTQPGAIAYQLFDDAAPSAGALPSDYLDDPRVIKAGSLGELASLLGIDARRLSVEVEAFNSYCRASPADSDGGPEGQPPRRSLRSPVEKPPFIGAPVACGLTFTFGGLAVDHAGRVLDGDDRPISGLFAAGELVGGLFAEGYPGGAGLLAGAVMGRQAGASAACSGTGDIRAPATSASSHDRSASRI